MSRRRPHRDRFRAGVFATVGVCLASATRFRARCKAHGVLYLVARQAAMSRLHSPNGTYARGHFQAIDRTDAGRGYFLSMVDGPPDDGQLANRDEGPRSLYKKRYNVAVSRARSQLCVVYSLDPSAHLKPRDLRRRLIEHARDPQALMRAMEVQGKRTDSIFEKAGPSTVARVALSS
jgi:hypothetical protein